METTEIVRKEQMFDKCYRLNVDEEQFINHYVRSSDNEQNIVSPFKKETGKNEMYYYDLLDRLFLPKDGIKSIGNYRQIKKD